MHNKEILILAVFATFAAVFLIARKQQKDAVKEAKPISYPTHDRYGMPIAQISPNWDYINSMPEGWQ